jgi:hypothetical protein
MRAVLAGGRDERMEVDIPKAERDAQVRFDQLPEISLSLSIYPTIRGKKKSERKSSS